MACLKFYRYKNVDLEREREEWKRNDAFFEHCIKINLKTAKRQESLGLDDSRR